jgi:Holliday junction resolvase RusA-like endonuclease
MSQQAERQAWTDFVEQRENIQSTLGTLVRPTRISFTVDGRPAPQGSMKGVSITRADGAPGTIFMSDNPHTHPYRKEVAWAALRARTKAGLLNELFAPAGVAVRMGMTFVFVRPKSAPKTRLLHIVKPDCSKLIRSTEDAMIGVIYKDDCQIVGYDTLEKIYGHAECVHISIRLAVEMEA